MVADVRGMIHSVHDKKKGNQETKKTSVVSPSAQREWGNTGNATGELADIPVRSYKLVAAGVLPIIYDKKYNQIKAILGRQTGLDSVYEGKYGYFTGSVQEKDRGDSVVAAAREWCRESRLGEILEWGETDARQFIQKHTKGYIILAAHLKNEQNTYRVMYLVDIGQTDIHEKLFKKFEPSYQKTLFDKKNGEMGWDPFLRKDKLIEVKWNDLLELVGPQNPNPLMPIKYSGELDDKKIELQDTFVFLLQGIIDRRNRLQNADLKAQFPLGIFIFARQQLAEKKIEIVDLTLEEKDALNYEVMYQLEDEEAIEQEQKAVVGQASKVENLDLSKDVEKAMQNRRKIEEQKKKNEEEQAIVEQEKTKPFSSEQLSTLAAAVKVRQTEKGIVEQQSPEEPIVTQKNDGMFSSIGESIWASITNLTRFVSDFFNWLGRGFPQ